MAYILSKKLNKKEKQRVLSAMKKFHKENEKIENTNKSIREYNSSLKRQIKEIKQYNKTSKRKAPVPKANYYKEVKMQPATKVIRELRSKGISYSENNMYHDIRRSGATFNAKTTQKRQRAAKWFDDYFEPMRKKKGVSSKKAYDIWKKAQTQSYDNMTMAELEFALELREMGSP
jgi:hypothetical protein